MSIQIAVDAMGGDHAPEAVVKGAVQIAPMLENRAHILLIGQSEILSALLQETGFSGNNVSIIDAPEVIGMGESPSAAIKTKTKSSIHIGLGLCKMGKAQAFVSAGNTGAVMGASMFILGRLPKVMRPSVIAYFPTTQGHSIIVDAGTNVDCKPEHLVQFAQMGSIFVQRMMHKEHPVIATMNIGEEKGKGNEAVKEVYDLLEQHPDLNFKGNIEGRDVLGHAADVIVCDGFVGNIMLKLGESVATTLSTMIKTEMDKQGLSGDEQKLVSKVMNAVQSRFDHEEYGGAPLLGVAGNVLISHGSSSHKAFEKAILAALELAEQDVAGAIASALN